MSMLWRFSARRAAVPALCLLLAACPKINAPDLSGTDGISGYAKPAAPRWLKKENGVRFYAETKGNEYYLYDNMIHIPGGDGCACGNPSYICECVNSPSVCVCKIPAAGIIRVTVRLLSADNRDEAGVVFAETSGTDHTETDFKTARKFCFTINAAKNEWRLQLSGRNISGAAALNAHGENTLIIHYDTNSENIYKFYINDDTSPDTPLYTAQKNEFDITSGYIYYYVTLKDSAPSRNSPFMVEYSTRSPYRYP